MTMPEQLYLPKQLISDDFETDDVVQQRHAPSWLRRLLVALIVLRSHQARAFLESQGYVRDRAPGELYRKYRPRHG